MSRVRIVFPDPPMFTHELDVRVSDLNYGNHLGHDSLVSLLHEARVRFFLHFDMEERNIDGVGILLVDLAVAYRAQVFHGQVLRIDVTTGDASAHGCDLIYRVTDRDAGKVVALARTGIVFYDYQERRVAEMPTRFRQLLRRADGEP
jgi:acyl-CoA thioester hydrolase